MHTSLARRRKRRHRPRIIRCTQCGGRRGFCRCQMLLLVQQIVISDPNPFAVHATIPLRLDFCKVSDHHELSMRPLVYDRPTIDLSQVEDLEDRNCFKQGSQCAVCLDTVESHGAVVSLCGGLSSNAHCFHSECLLESTRHVWENDLKSKCPICREPIEERNLRCMEKFTPLTTAEKTSAPVKHQLSEREIKELVKKLCSFPNSGKKEQKAKKRSTGTLIEIRRTSSNGQDPRERVERLLRAMHNGPNFSKLNERLIHNHLLQLWRAEEDARRARREERRRKKEKKKSKRRNHAHRKPRDRKNGGQSNIGGRV